MWDFTAQDLITLCNPVIIFSPLKLTLSLYFLHAYPCPSKPEINELIMTNDWFYWDQSTKQDSLTCSEKWLSNMYFSTSLEEMYLASLQKQPNSFKSSKLLPDWFFGVVLWLTWPARNPTTLICDFWGHSMRSAIVCSETEKAGDEVFEEHHSKMRHDT